VIRMNRDTLYSFAVVDISQGAAFWLPEGGGRYLSAMVVNEEHYINRVFHEAGEYRLAVDEFDTPYVLLAVRIMVDPRDVENLAAVAALQDQISIRAVADRPFTSPDYDAESLDRTRTALLTLAAGMDSLEHSFGARDDVDPVHHLITTAAGWGGLPDAEATYIGVAPGLPVGKYTLTVGEVPVDGFWSISVYNADGFFEPNDSGAYSINNLTAARNDDNTVTVLFGGDGDPAQNSLPITEGWNYLVRLYRPRPEILNGTWKFPELAS